MPAAIRLSSDGLATGFECGNCGSSLTSFKKLLAAGDPRVTPAPDLSARQQALADGTTTATVFRTSQSWFLNPLPRSFDVMLVESFDGAGAVADEVGPPGTLEFTWFEGRAHRIVVCRKCNGHIGWSYAARDGSKFFGLALAVSKWNTWLALQLLLVFFIWQCFVGNNVYLATGALGIALVKIAPHIFW